MSWRRADELSAQSAVASDARNTGPLADNTNVVKFSAGTAARDHPYAGSAHCKADASTACVPAKLLSAPSAHGRGDYDSLCASTHNGSLREQHCTSSVLANTNNGDSGSPWPRPAKRQHVAPGGAPLAPLRSSENIPKLGHGHGGAPQQQHFAAPARSVQPSEEPALGITTPGTAAALRVAPGCSSHHPYLAARPVAFCAESPAIQLLQQQSLQPQRQHRQAWPEHQQHHQQQPSDRERWLFDSRDRGEWAQPSGQSHTQQPVSESLTTATLGCPAQTMAPRYTGAAGDLKHIYWATGPQRPVEEPPRPPLPTSVHCLDPSVRGCPHPQQNPQQNSQDPGQQRCYQQDPLRRQPPSQPPPQALAPPRRQQQRQPQPHPQPQHDQGNISAQQQHVWQPLQPPLLPPQQQQQQGSQMHHLPHSQPLAQQRLQAQVPCQQFLPPQALPPHPQPPQQAPQLRVQPTDAYQPQASVPIREASDAVAIGRSVPFPQPHRAAFLEAEDTGCGDVAVDGARLAQPQRPIFSVPLQPPYNPLLVHVQNSPAEISAGSDAACLSMNVAPQLQPQSRPGCASMTGRQGPTACSGMLSWQQRGPGAGKGQHMRGPQPLPAQALCVPPVPAAALVGVQHEPPRTGPVVAGPKLLQRPVQHQGQGQGHQEVVHPQQRGLPEPMVQQQLQGQPCETHGRQEQQQHQTHVPPSAHQQHFQQKQQRQQILSHPQSHSQPQQQTEQQQQQTQCAQRQPILPPQQQQRSELQTSCELHEPLHVEPCISTRDTSGGGSYTVHVCRPESLVTGGSAPPEPEPSAPNQGLTAPMPLPQRQQPCGSCTGAQPPTRPQLPATVLPSLAVAAVAPQPAAAPLPHTLPQPTAGPPAPPLPPSAPLQPSDPRGSSRAPPEAVRSCCATAPWTAPSSATAGSTKDLGVTGKSSSSSSDSSRGEAASGIPTRLHGTSPPLQPPGVTAGAAAASGWGALVWTGNPAGASGLAWPAAATAAAAVAAAAAATGFAAVSAPGPPVAAMTGRSLADRELFTADCIQSATRSHGDLQCRAAVSACGPEGHVGAPGMVAGGEVGHWGTASAGVTPTGCGFIAIETGADLRANGVECSASVAAGGQAGDAARAAPLAPASGGSGGGCGDVRDVGCRSSVNMGSAAAAQLGAGSSGADVAVRGSGASVGRRLPVSLSGGCVAATASLPSFSSSSGMSAASAGAQASKPAVRPTLPSLAEVRAAKAAEAAAAGGGGGGAQRPATRLPVLQFEGSVRYAATAVEVDWLCGQVEQARPRVIGLDMEWRPQYVAGSAGNRTALLQICYATVQRGRPAAAGPAAGASSGGSGGQYPSVEPRGGQSLDATAVLVEEAAASADGNRGRHCCCLLLHIFHSGVTPRLRALLEAEELCKVGVNITGDANKLKRDYGVEMRGMTELDGLANDRVLQHIEHVTINTEYRSRWSLSALVETVLRRYLPKPNNIRCGNWERQPLDAAQQRYAALDAYAGLAVWAALVRLPLRRRAPLPAAQTATADAAAVAVTVADQTTRVSELHHQEERDGVDYGAASDSAAAAEKSTLAATDVKAPGSIASVSVSAADSTDLGLSRDD